MNDHEMERIAMAAHALRPDWPIKSLTTLMRKPELANRPRRDVAVALAWVACDPNTATPARVLEAGPWWRAAAVEGATHVPRNLRPSESCWNGDHRYSAEPPCCTKPVPWERRWQSGTEIAHPDAIRAGMGWKSAPKEDA